MTLNELGRLNPV